MVRFGTRNHRVRCWSGRNLEVHRNLYTFEQIGSWATPPEARWTPGSWTTPPEARRTSVRLVGNMRQAARIHLLSATRATSVPTCQHNNDDPRTTHKKRSNYSSVSPHHQHFIPSMVSFMCPQCSRTCKSLSGLTRHKNSAHRDDPRLNIPVTELQRIYHPSLNGTYKTLDITPSSFSEGRRCDGRGTFLPAEALPEPPTTKADDDWTPFASRAGFELAEFLFVEAELSHKKIDKLLELWAATLIPHGDSPPIINHQDLHRQIDAIKLGNIQWECAPLKYDRPLPKVTRPPEWMTTEYDVWYRDPHKVIKNMLANPDFDGHIDYAAYQEFDGEKRQYSNMLSGDWSWQQSVRFFLHSMLLPTLRTPPLG